MGYTYDRYVIMMELLLGIREEHQRGIGTH